MRLTTSAHAKINWALNITGRRADGYHLLDMLMHSIALSDELCFEEDGALSLSVDGAACPGEDNLVMKAAKALNRRTGRRCGARIGLVKRIPERAGLGGGSADCAAALVALNRLWGLGLSRAELLSVGEELGADVPFCLTGGLAVVRGIGERIEPVRGAPVIPLVVARAGGGLSTAQVFGLWDGGGFPEVALDTRALAETVVRRDLPGADRLCANALEAPAISLLPEIGRTIEQLRALGAAAAFMTGSGSAVVGAFEDPAEARRAAGRIPGALLTHTLPDSPPDAFLS